MAQDTKTTKYGFDIEDVLNSTGITYNRLVNKGLSIGRINVNKTVNPIDITNFGKNYIFFSKPDLNLFIDNKGTINPSIEANCPDLAQKIKRNLWVAQSLQASLTTEATRGPGSGLVHVLSDKCSSAEVPQITLSQKEAPKNSKGFGMSYGGNFFEDLVGKEITIEFIDNGADSDVLYNEFDKAIYNKNPLIKLAAIDLIKYAVQVEGMRLTHTDRKSVV